MPSSIFTTRMNIHSLNFELRLGDDVHKVVASFLPWHRETQKPNILADKFVYDATQKLLIQAMALTAITPLINASICNYTFY